MEALKDHKAKYKKISKRNKKKRDCLGLGLACAYAKAPLDVPCCHSCNPPTNDLRNHVSAAGACWGIPPTAEWQVLLLGAIKVKLILSVLHCL
jgi:hypothetical protein